MNKLTNNPIDDLKGEMLKTKNNNYDWDISSELKKETTHEDIQYNQTKDNQEKEKKQAKTYRLSPQLINDMNKVLYMDRELRGNETTLITKAIEKYIYSKENKELIKQYDELKGK